jgi:hypothetical protein
LTSAAANNGPFDPSEFDLANANALMQKVR